MFNAANKHLSTLAIAVMMAFASCSSSGADPETEAARELYGQAKDALDAGDFNTTLALLDSLDSIYPNQFDTRRLGLALRPQAMEKKTIALIQSTDSAIAINAEELAHYHPMMKEISSSQLLEPYFVVADAYNPSFISQTAVEPRVDADGNFYIVAQVQGANIGLNQLQLNTSTGMCASQSVAPDRVIKESGSELISFRMEEVDSLGHWAFNRGNDVVSATLIGKSGKPVTVKLTPAQARAFGSAWRYSRLRRDQTALMINRERLERQLLTARTQIANTAHQQPDTQGEK